MCLDIDESVKSLNKRIVWKVFDKGAGKVLSLYRHFAYPKGKLIERSPGDPTYHLSNGALVGSCGLHFYTSKAKAVAVAKSWRKTYIAKFEVSPNDFMFADGEGEAMYERATRVGNYIQVSKRGG